MSKFVVIGTISVVPEDIGRFEKNEGSDIYNKEFKGINIRFKDSEDSMFSEGVTVEEATQILNNYFKEQVSNQADSLKCFFEGLDRVIDGGSLSHMFNKYEVPGPEPVTVEDYLKTDPVTIAVDKCNEIFASNELTKDLYLDKVGTPEDGTSVAYGRRNGKLYTIATLEKVKEIESRVTPKEEG